LANDGTNIVTSATPLTIVTSNSAQSSRPLSIVNDGSTDTNQYFCTDPPGSTTIEVDLGSIIRNLASVKFWHYYLDSRTYYNVELMVSKDRVRWQRIYGSTDTLATAAGTEIILATLDQNLPPYIIPTSYSYSVQPSASYPDTGNIEMTDGVVAGKYFPSGGSLYYPPWVRWDTNTNPIITFSFPFNVTINKVSIHFQGDHIDSIALPKSLSIGKALTNIADVTANGWNVFSGNWMGNKLTLNFTSRPQTFIAMSEIKFTEGNSGILLLIY